MKARRSWSHVIQTLREHKCQPRLIYQAKSSNTIGGETKEFHDKTKFTHYLSTNPAHQRIITEKTNTRMETTSQKKQEGNPSTNLKQDSHKNRMPTLKTKIIGSNNYFCLISLNINGLNSPIKRHRLTDWLHKQDPIFCCLRETHVRKKTDTTSE